MISRSVLLRTIEKSWSKDTCYPKEQNSYSRDNPALGQCAVTALLIQDYLQGNILFSEKYNHYWNELANGDEIDITRKQFGDNIDELVGSIATRYSLLNTPGAIKYKTRERYILLKKATEEEL